MLRFEVLTLFPDIFTSFLEESLIKRAIEKQYLNVSLVNFRKHGHGKHLQVDDTPYGGGPGMVLRIEPIALTLKEQKEFHRSKWPGNSHNFSDSAGTTFFTGKSKRVK